MAPYLSGVWKTKKDAEYGVWRLSARAHVCLRLAFGLANDALSRSHNAQNVFNRRGSAWVSAIGSSALNLVTCTGGAVVIG